MDTYLHARFTCLLTHSLTRSLTCSLSSLTGLLGLAQLPGKISSIICSLTSRSYSALSLAYYEKVVLSIQVVFCVVKSYSARPSWLCLEDTCFYRLSCREVAYGR